MEIDIAELGKRIMEYRFKNNVSQREMAKILDITELTLVRLFKKNVKTRYMTLMKIDSKLKELEGK